MATSPTARQRDFDIQTLVAAVGARFVVPGAFVLGEAIDTGHINSTYRGTFRESGGMARRYIFQSINRQVFKDPYAVMRNVEKVTRHINSRFLQMQLERPEQTLNLLPARDGKAWVEDENGAIWRCYNHIEGCVTYDIVENTRQAFQAARAFGAFQELVRDLNPRQLVETIPGFHDTRKRFARLTEVAIADPRGRLELVRPEYNAILERESMAGRLLDLASKGKIPVRITHNDTKINNVMIDAETDEAVCVIDLDTVMPGLALYDFGDLVRTATSPAAEDETDLAKVEMRLPFYQALVSGYLASAGNFLNQTEIELLPFAGKLITYEVAIRFLTDYLEGDIYFRTNRVGHNLDRCRNQLQLLRSMEERL